MNSLQNRKVTSFPLYFQSFQRQLKIINQISKKLFTKSDYLPLDRFKKMHAGVFTTLAAIYQARLLTRHGMFRSKSELPADNAYPNGAFSFIEEASSFHCLYPRTLIAIFMATRKAIFHWTHILMDCLRCQLSI